MTDMTDGWGVYPPDDPRNPFYGLDGFDEFSETKDPHEGIERQVMDALGIQDFDSILVLPDERTTENARGNRFSSLTEAITYLFDAGILQFSGVVIGAEELEVEIEPQTDKRRGKR